MPTFGGLTGAQLSTREGVMEGLARRGLRAAVNTVTTSVNQLVTAAATPTISTTASTQGAVTLAPIELSAAPKSWDAYVETVLYPFLVETYTAAAQATWGAVGDSLDVVIPPVSESFAAEYLRNAANRLKNVGNELWVQLREQLALGYDAGESVQQLAARVRTFANDFSEARALTIARTEVVAAANQGSLAQVQLAGFSDLEAEKRWLATDDARTRPEHLKADGQVVGLSQAFHVGGEYLQFPGDPTGRADNVINCRCSLEFIFTGEVEAEVEVEDELLTADAKFELVHPRGEGGRFSPKSKFSILPKHLRGKSGDRMYGPSMWGRYGAAGVMMRHVDESGKARYLLVQRSSPGKQQWKWQLPGGALEEKETPEQGAAREAFEEVGATPEFLDQLTHRGNHEIERQVEGKDPWHYTNVAADVPYQFTPKVDRGDGELWKAVWLTEEQIREMMTRDRLVAPLAENIDKILAKFDEPVVASSSHLGYSDSVTVASKWDESEHPRDPEGKFAKKASSLLSALLNAPSPSVVAVGTGDNANRRMRKSGSGFYIEKQKPTGTWIVVSKKIPPNELKDYLDVGNWDLAPDLKKAEGPNVTTVNVPESTLKAVAAKHMSTPIVIKEMKEVKTGTPLHINTNVIYKQTYADQQVVAEKINSLNDKKMRLVWNASAKKFTLQTEMSDGTWNDFASYGKGEAYKKFSKETGWLTPDSLSTAPASAATTGESEASQGAAIIKKVQSTNTMEGFAKLSVGEQILWLSSLNPNSLSGFSQNEVDHLDKYVNKLLYDDDISNIEHAAIKESILNFAPLTSPTTTTPAHLEVLDDFLASKGAVGVNWVKSLTVADLAQYDDAQLDKIESKVVDLLNAGHLTYDEAKKFDQLKTKASLPSIVNVPNFNGDSAITITAFYAHLTQDDFDSLSASDQALVQSEAPFWDDLAPPGAKYSDKIANFVAGKGDSDSSVNPALESAILMMSQGDYDALSKAEKIKLYEDSKKLPDSTGAVQKKMEDLITTHINNKSGGTSEPKITFDWDDISGPEETSPVLYNGVPIAFAQSTDDGSGAYLYSIDKNGEIDSWIGTVEFSTGITVEDAVQAHISTGVLTPPIGAPSTPGASGSLLVDTTPRAAKAPTSTPANASSWYVDVHNKIKPVGSIGVPKIKSNAVLSYKVVTPAEAEALQQSVLTSTGKSWTTTQKSAIKRYGTSVGYRSTNAVLRDDKDQQAKLNASDLDAGVKNAVNLQNAMTPLPKNLKLFRGTGAHAFGQNSIAANFDELKKLEGHTITDKGFMSTTVDEKKGVSYDYAKKPIQMIVNTPAGTPAVYVDSAIPGHGEHEYVLGAGTSFRVNEVRKATAEDHAKYGSHVQHVVDVTVVPTTSSSSTPLSAPPAKPDPAVAPAVLTPVPSPAVTTPTIGPIKASDLKKPMKLTTTVIYKQKYQDGAVVAYRKNPDGALSRLVWSETNKKFILQNQGADPGTWINFAGYNKGETYQKYAKTGGTWYQPPSGDSALGTGGVFGFTAPTPSISTTVPAPSPSSSGTSVAVKKPQPKFDAAELQKLHGQIPTNLGPVTKRSLFDRFKKSTSKGFVTLSSSESNLFEALHETLEWNHELSKNDPNIPKLNMLQLLKVIDEESTNKANAVAKAKGEAGDLINAELYEKKIVAWLQTSSGATAATNIIHPPAYTTTVINGQTYKSPNLTPAVLATLGKIKTPSSIGTPDVNAKTFKTLSVSEAYKLQNQMLASEPWTPTQSAAIRKYSTSYYTEMNPVIRDLTDEIKYKSEGSLQLAARTAVNIQAGMRPLPESVRVFRKTSPKQFPGLNDYSKFEDVKQFEGKLFIDRAPLSTSVSSGKWSGKVHMTIDLPAGTPAAFIKSVSENPSEDEMLLALGLKYRVLEVTDAGYGNINVHLRIEP